MDFRWSETAYQVAAEAGKEGSAARRRWGQQDLWDAENMRTVSTRLTLDQDAELRQCCQEAHVTRYALTNYLLRAWMAAWWAYRDHRAAADPGLR